ncbi:hypothetical protein SLEP1_g17048 [Rubroshorea leprosula]|uniref:Uncharacterized protein n=1 Tax=Rubroshorea leprosula TaxID=152421 RepID=A0AAV5J4K1_9ROSI|nr:hypothetical protein SLEP1_g17048 [Rubroshorea leprosula]
MKENRRKIEKKRGENNRSLRFPSSNAEVKQTGVRNSYLAPPPLDDEFQEE